MNISRSKIVLYSPSEMYQLVDAIEDYPQFLQWCTASEIHSRSVDEVQASLTLSFSGLRKSFTTCNRLQKNKMIEIRLVQGPFHHLEGLWRFEKQANGGCEILLDFEFEFAGRLLSMAIGPVFHQMASTLVDAFSERAIEVYGKRN